MSKRISEHHVIIAKHGEDIYIDEMKIESGYREEKGRIENVITITGNLEPNDHLMLTQDEIVELRDILEIIIEKERNRIGNNQNWGRRTLKEEGEAI